uniref:hypothetical protein n=1 Tax=Limosilactobacillus fermentum TaxID=1613 RepID=UPI0021C1866A
VANDIKYGPRDIIVDGQDGILTQNGDKAGLAAAIIDLLEDDDIIWPRPGQPLPAKRAFNYQW